LAAPVFQFKADAVVAIIVGLVFDFCGFKGGGDAGIGAGGFFWVIPNIVLVG
jgi:hypothetical protein